MLKGEHCTRDCQIRLSHPERDFSTEEKNSSGDSGKWDQDLLSAGL